MNKLALILAAAALCAAPGSAGPMPAADHLEPVMSATEARAIADRNADVEIVLFKEAFASNVLARVRVYVLPGGYEEMIFLTGAADGYRLVNLYSSESIWWFAGPRIQRRDRTPEPLPDPSKAVVLRGEIAISPELAKQIIADWKRLLQQTRYETEHSFAYDGIRYTLSMQDATGWYAGEIWNPYDLPVIGAMAKAVDSMMMYCPYGETSAEKCTKPDAAGIEEMIRQLTQALDKQKQ
jgi:hypothetical protein